MQFHLSVDLYVKDSEWLLQELNNRNVYLGNHKSSRGNSQEPSLTRAFHFKVKVTVQMGLHKGGQN